MKYSVRSKSIPNVLQNVYVRKKLTLWQQWRGRPKSSFLCMGCAGAAVGN